MQIKLCQNFLLDWLAELTLISEEVCITFY